VGDPGQVLRCGGGPVRARRGLRAACATPEMLAAIAVAPLAASATLRVISLVVAVCSSTPLAIVVWVSLI
jgi:hypothetical protein